jgi:hypothetical protein
MLSNASAYASTTTLSTQKSAPSKRSSVNNQLTKAERAHVGRVKALPCSVCDQAGPSDAHHVKQHRQYVCIALCKDCHQGAFNGLHGQRRMWAVKKMDEMDALNVTIQRLLEN